MKKKEIWYKNFVVHMEEGKISRFEATDGTHAYDAAEGVIFFLNYRNVEGEYDFIFNDKCVKVNKQSKQRDIVDEIFVENEYVL